MAIEKNMNLKPEANTIAQAIKDANTGIIGELKKLKDSVGQVDDVLKGLGGSGTTKGFEKIADGAKNANDSVDELNTSLNNVGKTSADKSINKKGKDVEKATKTMTDNVIKEYKKLSDIFANGLDKKGENLVESLVGTLSNNDAQKVAAAIRKTKKDVEEYKKFIEGLQSDYRSYNSKGKHTSSLESLAESFDGSEKLYDEKIVNQSASNYKDALEKSGKSVNEKIEKMIEMREKLYFSFQTLKEEVNFDEIDFTNKSQIKEAFEILTRMAKISKAINVIDKDTKSTNKEHVIDTKSYLDQVEQFASKILGKDVLSQLFGKNLNSAGKIFEAFGLYASECFSKSFSDVDTSGFVKSIENAADEAKQKVEDSYKDVNKYITNKTKLDGSAYNTWTKLNKTNPGSGLTEKSKYKFVGQIADIERKGAYINKETKAYKEYLKLLEENADLRNFANEIKGRQSSDQFIDTEKIDEELKKRKELNDEYQRAKDLGSDMSGFKHTGSEEPADVEAQKEALKAYNDEKERSIRLGVDVSKVGSIDGGEVQNINALTEAMKKMNDEAERSSELGNAKQAKLNQEELDLVQRIKNEKKTLSDIREYNDFGDYGEEELLQLHNELSGSLNNTSENTSEVEENTQAHNRNNDSLAEKLQYLKDIQKHSKFMETAEDRRISMEDKAYDVGGRNPKSEADSQKKIKLYEDLCEGIDKSTAALDEFEREYESVIVTMKDGSEIEIFDFSDLDELKLLKSKIKDIKFNPFEDFDMDDVQSEIKGSTTLPLFEDKDSGQLSFIEQTKKSTDLIEEESGQMAFFKVQAEAATDSAIEGQMHLNDYLEKNIEGQMTLNDLMNQQKTQKDEKSYEKLLKKKYEIKNVGKSSYSNKDNYDWIGIYKSREEAIEKDLERNKTNLHSSLNLILSEDKEVLNSLNEEANKLKSSLQPVQDMVNRISSNSSIAYLNENEGSEGYAEAYKAIDDRLGELYNKYDLTNEELEEYVALQVKAKKIMDERIDIYGGIKGSGAKNRFELEKWIEESFARDLGIDPEEIYNGLFGNITNALYEGHMSLYDNTGKQRSLRTIAAEILDYNSVTTGISGGFGADEDARNLREINAILTYIKKNANEIETTDFSEKIKRASDSVDFYARKVSEGEHVDFFSEQLERAQAELQELISLQERLNTARGIKPSTPNTSPSKPEVVDSSSTQKVTEEVQELTQAEIEAAQKAKEIGQAFGITNKNALKEIQDVIFAFNQNSSNDSLTDENGFLVGDFDDELDLFANAGTGINDVLDTISKHIKSSKSEMESYVNTWKEVRKYVSNSKINISDGVKSELGDDYSSMLSTIGRGNISTDRSGADIIAFLSEMNSQLGTTFDLTVSNQDAFRQLYDFLKNKPLEVDIDTLPESIRNTVNQILDGTYKQEADRKYKHSYSSPKVKDVKFSVNKVSDSDKQEQISAEATADAVEQAEKRKQVAKKETERVTSETAVAIANAEKKEQEVEKQTADVVVDSEQKKQSAKTENDSKASKDSGKKVPKSLQFNIEDLTEKELERKIKAAENAINSNASTSDTWKEKLPAMKEAYELLVKQRKEQEEIAEELRRENIERNKREALEAEHDDRVISQRGLVGDEDGWTVTNKTGEAQTQTVSYKYDDDGNLDSTKMPIATNFEMLSRMINETDKQIANLEARLENNKRKFKDAYDSTYLEKVITSTKKYLGVLEEEAKHYGEEPEYAASYSQFEKEREKNKEIIDNLKADKIAQAQAQEEQKRIKAIESSNSFLSKQENTLKDIQSLYDSKINPNAKKALKDEKDLSSLREKQLKIETKIAKMKDTVVTQAQKDEIYSDIKDLERTRKSYTDKEYGATELSSKELDISKKIVTNDFDSFITKLKSAGTYTESLTSEVKTFKETLDSIDNSKGIKNAKDQLKEYESRFKSLRAAELAKQKSDKESNDEYKKQFKIIKNYSKEQDELNKLLAQEAKKGSSNELTAKIDAQKKKVKDLKEEAEKARDAISEMLNVSKGDKDKAFNLFKDVEGGKTESFSVLSGALKDKDKKDLEKAYKAMSDTEEKYRKLSIKRTAGTATGEQLAELKEIQRVRNEAAKVIRSKTAAVQEETEAQRIYNEVQDQTNQKLSQFVEKEQKIKELMDSSSAMMNDFANDENKQALDGFDDIYKYYQGKVDDENAKLMNIKDPTTKNLDAYKKEIAKIRKDLNSIVVGNVEIDDAEQAMRQYFNTIGLGANNIGKFDDENKSLVASFKDSKNNVYKVKLEYDELTHSIKRVGLTSEKAKSGLSSFLEGLGGRIKALAQYLLSFVSFYEVVAVLKQGITHIRDLDSALTEMRKVSDETVSSLKNFQDVSFDIASNIGTTAKQIQNSAADFMRLGYSLKEASELAEDANIYANVGDMEIGEATEHMISSIQAWKSEFSSEVEASEAIVDRYNEIGNNFAISSAEIGSAMERSAAALKAGGNTLNESLGLITAGNVIQQDAETTAAALKILSLRIRGAKTDLENMGEETDGLASSTSKMRDEIKALTGVDIMLDEDTFKSTAQIIQEIGAVYDELSDVSQAALLEKLAGKNRASTVAGLLENYEIIGDVIKSAEGADGSAAEENARYLDSIEGRIEVLTNKSQEFWHTLIDSEVVKGGLSALTNMLDVVNNIVDTLGLLGTASVLGAGAFGIKNLFSKDSGGRDKKFSLVIKYATESFSREVCEFWCISE